MRDKSNRPNGVNRLDALDVEVVTLPPMTVAAARAFGPHPEMEAWQTLLSWARLHGLAPELVAHHFYGFNNPDPVPGEPDYGYEQWISVDREAQGDDRVVIRSFPGGRFLATRCDDLRNLGTTWRRLFRWCQRSTFAPEFDRPFLEECLTPLAREPADFCFRLLLPVSAVAQAAPSPRAA
jgi:DNA gyrase inhibitor GyrI